MSIHVILGRIRYLTMVCGTFAVTKGNTMTRRHLTPAEEEARGQYNRSTLTKEIGTLIGITEYFNPAIGWTNRAMTGKLTCPRGKPMVTATDGGIFATVLDHAEVLQFCSEREDGLHYSDIPMYMIDSGETLEQ